MLLETQDPRIICVPNPKHLFTVISSGLFLSGRTVRSRLSLSFCLVSPRPFSVFTPRGNATTPGAGSDLSQYDKITEGRASILVPKENKVFYNPIQQFNRDISVLGIRAWSQLFEAEPRNQRYVPKDPSEPYIDVIEALSASGLRAVRYGLEIPRVRSVLANDFSESAVDAIRRNVTFCGVEGTVHAHEGDANMTMYKHRGRNVHVVDLDPYGSAAPFMDAAVQAVRDDGLLLVTCTDLGVLAGNGYPEKCFAQYGGTTVWSDACHESALRLVLNMVAASAARYGRAIEPMLSLSVDFYVRLFIRIKTSPRQVKENASKSMVVYHCRGCGSSVHQPLGKSDTSDQKYGYARGPLAPENCEHCGTPHHIAGPLWAGPIHHDAFIDKMLEIQDCDFDPAVYATAPRIKGMLTMARDELKDVPFYFSVQQRAAVIKASSPPHRAMVSALCNAGYRVSGTHAHAGCLKTDAPFSFIWAIYRRWLVDMHNGVISPNLKPGAPGATIVRDLPAKIDAADSNPRDPEISFVDHPRALELDQMRKSKFLRYQQNPQKNWGPRARAISISKNKIL
jgi:tRNA (guanine26-N2/guanine27-N2)-dimethyltransferase